MSPSQEPVVIRRLSCLEPLYTSLEAVGRHCGVAISCRYTLSHWPAESGLRASVQAALARTVLQHAVLRVGIIDTTSRRPSFVRLDSVDLGWHLEWRDISTEAAHDTILNKTLQAQLGSKFPHLKSRPAWRVVVLLMRESKSLELIFSWHHSLFDGIGATIFHRTLLHHLNATPEDSPLPELDKGLLDVRDSNSCLPPPQDKLCKHPVGLRYAVSTMWRMLKPAPYDSFATRPPIRAHPIRIQLRSISVDDQVLHKVLAACRENKTTLTGLLHGITLVSLATYMYALPGKAHGLSSHTTVNLRPFYPWRSQEDRGEVPSNTIINMSSFFGHTFDAATVDQIGSCATTNGSHKRKTQGFVWAAAASVREDTRQALRLGVKNTFAGLAAITPDMRPVLKYMAKAARPSSWMVSNLGVLGECIEKGPWSITRGSFGLSAEVAGSVLYICPFSVQGQELCVNVVWHDDVIDTRIAEQLVKDVGEWLMYIGGTAESCP